MADIRKFFPKRVSFPGFRYVRGKDFINGNLQFRYTAGISSYVYPTKSVKRGTFSIQIGIQIVKGLDL